MEYTVDFFVEKFRTFISDHEDLNKLDLEEETTDDEIREFLTDALIEINVDFTPRTYWGFADIVVDPEDRGYLSWNVLKQGATLQYLTSKGILSARNQLSYSDAGGVNVQAEDRYGRYINMYNVLINKYRAGVNTAKIRYNTDRSYGEIHSPMASWY